MGLKEYTRKRDFKKTPEPVGSKSQRGGKPVFVVQKHNARRLHYDFRLEYAGALKSWAVPKGPSLNPKDKRLAVEVEDHPLDYAKFEGVIPKGEYGAGKVIVWDKGTWRPTTEVDKGLKKGHLDFVLEGEKLKGKWTLIRLKGGKYESDRRDSGKNNWLLFKRDDTEARENYDVITEEPYSVLSHQEKLATTKSKKKKLDKLSPPPKFVEPQLAQLVVKPPQGREWVHEIKFDGYRTLCRIHKTDVRFLTRSGLDWTQKYLPLKADVLKLPTDNALLDGEIVWLDEKGITDFQGLQTALKEKRFNRMIYYVFDLLHLSGEDIRDLPLSERKALLSELFKDLGKSRILYSEHWSADGNQVLEQSCRHGLEGIVSKKSGDPYESGRGYSWQKIKCSNRQEIVIGGYTVSESQVRPFGALLMGVYDSGKLKYVGRVGTGFDDKAMRDIRAKLQKIKSKTSPFAIASPREKDVVFVRSKYVGEVEYKTITREGTFRQPSFKGLRLDKKPSEVTLETPKVIRSSASADSDMPKISHPDRVVYKKTKTKKIEVVRYYNQVASHMLPFMLDRPLSILRCQDQTGDECYFQKHATGRNLKGIQDRPVAYKDKKDTAITANSKGELLHLIQAGTIEIHGWGGRFSDITRPDLIVIDLDPESLELWDRVIETAHRIRDMLERLNLKSFVNVTGGKGLHVRVPIAPHYDWDIIKEFTRSLMVVLEDEDPERYTTNMSKKKRHGRIFLDYLRNGYGATAIIPYSLRARERPTVAMPVSWSQVKTSLAPNEFEMGEVLKILKRRRKDPWEDFWNLKQEIKVLAGTQSVE